MRAFLPTRVDARHIHDGGIVVIIDNFFFLFLRHIISARRGGKLRNVQVLVLDT